MTYQAHKLLEAIRAGSLFAVSAAIDDGADIEEADVHGNPGLPLRTACFEGNLPIVRELLSRGANPNTTSGDGPSGPLRLALRRNHKEIAALLLQNGARIPDNLNVPADVLLIECAPLPIDQAVPRLPTEDSDNLLEFTATAITPIEASDDAMTVIHDNQLEFTPSTLRFAIADAQPEESFGTETRALSADLLFLDEDPLLPISTEPASKT